MRLNREAKTIGIMIGIYCQARHGGDKDLCASCQALRTYAVKRARSCRFGERKPVCAKCRVHCYKHSMRDEIQLVMRHSSSRMLFRHPVLAVMHLLDSTREGPLTIKTGPKVGI
jgi:hypothetical protein